MKKQALFLLFISAIGEIAAQPMPCGPNPMMTTTCAPACVICDIDGFTGINNSNVQGQAPPGFCTSVVHHMQWIAFIAGTTDLTITVTPSNCQIGNGLEVGIYQTSDCANFTLVSNCDTDIQPGEVGVFKNVTPLTVGQYYYFVMDGNGDDICNWTIHVTQGTTNVLQLPPPGLISGPKTPCKGGTFEYSLPPLVGATFYVWSVDGITVDTTSMPQTSISWPVAGQHTVCVHAANVCDEGQPTCTDINVESLPPTVVEETICQGDTLIFNQKPLTASGQYSFYLKTADGCDSTVVLDLTVSQPSVETLAVTICSVDSFEVAGQFFKTAGVYNVPTSTVGGCDSLVILTLTTEVCPIHGTAKGDLLSCFGGTDGNIIVKMTDGTGPYSLSWKEVLSGQPTGSSTILATQGTADIGSLPAGIYNLTITDVSGKTCYLTAFITSPTPVGAEVTASIFGQFEISCPGSSDGSITVEGKGDFPLFTINWSSGQMAFSIDGLAAGSYDFTVTDAHGCTFSSSKILEEPPPLSLEIEAKDPGCAPSNDGAISANNPTGGQSPYQFALNDGAFQASKAFENLAPGDYFLKIKDSNGCLDSLSTTLAPPLTIPVDLGGPFTLELGDSLKMQPVTGGIPDTWEWNAAPGLSCLDCPSPWAMPTSDQTYVLTIKPAIGCPTSDSARVSVVKIRRVFIPNVFSPNDDGENDFLTVFAGKGAKQVRKLQVYDRWGELMFERKNFPPNNETLGWDGSFRGKRLRPGVYAVVSEVEFIDGWVEKGEGDVTIVK